MKIVLALSDGVADQIYGVLVVHSQNHGRNLAKNGEIFDPTGPEFPNRWTRIPGPEMADTRVKPGPDPVSCCFIQLSLLVISRL